MTATKRILAISITLGSLLTVPVQGAELAISSDRPLVFGSFAAGNGGTITVSTTGACSAGGSVIIIIPNCSNAEFIVTGDPDFTYLIELPANGFVTLTGPGTAMAINDFVSDPAVGANGVLSSGGSQILSVGATLTVGSNQAPGSYSGGFSVIVHYN